MVVVGAGVSGLVAATELQAAGVEITCLEARDQVGGRTRSAGGWMDLGASWFWPGETAISSLVTALGLRTYPQHTAGDALFEQPDGVIVRLSGNPLDGPAFRLADGMQAVASELARRLAPGVLETGSPVESVTVDPGGWLTVVSAGATILAEAVVLAVPPRLATTSITFSPPLPSDVVRVAAATPTWMADTVKAVAHFSRAFWRAAGLAGSAMSHVGPFVEFHDHSGPEDDQAALFGFAPAAGLVGLSETDIAERFVQQIARLWGPEGREASQVLVTDWSRERFVAGGDAPQRLAYGHPLLNEAHLDGRLLFASTESSRAFGGHVEGAVRGGRRAAEQMLARLGSGLDV